MEKVEGLARQFLDWKRYNQGRAVRTIDAYADYLARLLLFFESIKEDPLQATDDELSLFTGIWLAKQGVTGVARRPYIAAVRGFYRWMHWKKHIDHNPSAGVDYPKLGRHLPIAMTRQSAEKLINAPDFNTFQGLRDGAILSIFVGCGLRAAGLVALNEGNMHQVLHDDQKRLVLKVIEKGNKERLLPVPQEAAMILRLYLDQPELKAIHRTTRSGDKVLFVSVNNRSLASAEYIGDRRRLSQRSINDMIKKYGRQCEIPEEQLHAHAARHLYGTELAESKVDILMRADLMGHEDVKDNKVYEHMALHNKFQEVDRANPLAKINTPMGGILKQLGGASRK